jgi:hypothetical protein
MLCAYGKNTKETVLDGFITNNLVAPYPRQDGTWFVMKPEEFDRENKRLSDQVLVTHNIANTFWTREGNNARFSDTFAQLVDYVDARDGSQAIPPWANAAKAEAYSKETKSRVKPGKSVGSMLVSTAKGEKYRGPLSLEAVKEHSPITYTNRAQALAETHLVQGTKDLASIVSQDKSKDKIAIAERIYRKALDTVVANLLFIHDTMPESQRQISKLWYDGANRIAQELSKKYGISLEQASAVIATQSPQTPWYDNVHHAHFIIDFFKNQQDKVLTQAHLDYFKKTSEAYPDQHQFIPLLRNDVGLKFSEMEMYHKAIMMRAVFDTEYDRRAPLRIPSGEIVGQMTSISSFNSYPFLVKAIEILTDPSTIDANLGNAPKVINFNNNIVDPNLPTEVTIDTHAIAAAYLMPYGSSSKAIKFDIGSASFFAEAYREAAGMRGILAREMQSITWEGARAMFPQNSKSPAFEKKIGDIWQQYKTGKTSLQETLQEVYANSFEIKTDWADQLAGSISKGPQDSGILQELRRGSGVPTSFESGDGGGNQVGVPGLGTGNQSGFQGSVASDTNPAAGNRLFSTPLEEATVLARQYASKSGISYQEPSKITSLDKDLSRRIAKAYDSAKHDPADPQVKAAYRVMAEETLAQFEVIRNAGYEVEINASEPYTSSTEMIEDLRSNKRLRILSTESEFGSTPITEAEREDNPLLQRTQFKDRNGVPLLVNDIFRFVHDFFGHAKLGNSFGPLGEENAWNVHVRMYSPLAARAMTAETRGQNSWVNFSGINDKAFELRDQAKQLRKEGKMEEANAMTAKVYEMMTFAEQKITLLPVEFSVVPEESTTETLASPGLPTIIVPENFESPC